MRSILWLFSVVFLVASGAHAQQSETPNYDDLVELHDDLRDYMVPGFTAGVVLDRFDGEARRLVSERPDEDTVSPADGADGSSTPGTAGEARDRTAKGLAEAA